jgi:hypothetical protein
MPRPPNDSSLHRPLTDFAGGGSDDGQMAAAHNSAAATNSNDSTVEFNDEVEETPAAPRRDTGTLTSLAPSTHRGIEEIAEFASHNTEVKFRWSVFVPQLVLRLFPFLMPLQLLPDFELQADHVVASIGCFFLLFGIVGSFSIALGAALVMLSMWRWRLRALLRCIPPTPSRNQRCCLRCCTWFCPGRLSPKDSLPFPWITTRTNFFVGFIIGMGCIVWGIAWRGKKEGTGYFDVAVWGTWWQHFTDPSTNTFLQMHRGEGPQDMWKAFGWASIGIGIYCLGGVVITRFRRMRRCRRGKEQCCKCCGCRKNDDLGAWNAPACFFPQFVLTETFSLGEYRVCFQTPEMQNDGHTHALKSITHASEVEFQGLSRDLERRKRDDDNGWKSRRMHIDLQKGEVFNFIQQNRLLRHCDELAKLKLGMAETKSDAETERNTKQILREQANDFIEPVKVESLTYQKHRGWQKKLVSYNEAKFGKLHIQVELDHKDGKIQRGIRGLNLIATKRPKDNAGHAQAQRECDPQSSQGLGAGFKTKTIIVRSDETCCGGDEKIPDQNSCASGYRITGSNCPEVDGDYLPEVDKSECDRELFFTNEKNQFILFYDDNTHMGTAPHGFWKIGRPEFNMRETDARRSNIEKFQPYFKAEQPDKDWKRTGPPKTGWEKELEGDVSGRLVFDAQQRDSQQDSQQLGSTEGTLRMAVVGFATVLLNLRVPRRREIRVKAWLGATVRSSENLEFLILQLEQFFLSLFQFTVLVILLVSYDHDYAKSKHKESIVDIDPWWYFVGNSTQSDTQDYVRITSSELILPAAMYVFLAFVLAHEHACFSGYDTLSGSREGRWYRRAIETGAIREQSGKRQEDTAGTRCCRCCCGGTGKWIQICDICNCKKLFQRWSTSCIIISVIIIVGILYLVLSEKDGIKSYFIYAGLLLLLAMTGVLWQISIVEALCRLWRRCVIFSHLCLLRLLLWFVSIFSKDELNEPRFTWRWRPSKDIQVGDRVLLRGTRRDIPWGLSTTLDLDWFSNHLKDNDEAMRVKSSYVYKRRDLLRKLELQQTYIDRPCWTKLEDTGQHGFIQKFSEVDETGYGSFDDGSINQNIKKTMKMMKVYPMRQNLDSGDIIERSSVSSLHRYSDESVFSRTSSLNNVQKEPSYDPFKEASDECTIKPSVSDDVQHKLFTWAADSCINAGVITDMVTELSKARQLLHKKGRWRIVLLVSFLHATVPIWHAWLPYQIGGGCGQQYIQFQCSSQQQTLDQHECERDTNYTFVRVNYTECSAYSHTQLQNGIHDQFPYYFPFPSGNVPLNIACSQNWFQVITHIMCAWVNFTLTFAILDRLVKCEADYHCRYCHMLYFIQLTPWSNIRFGKIKKHWGLLPTFELDTPGNVEAWNKIRMYLQSYQIKTSKKLQISAVYCCGAVIILSLFKIGQMCLIQSQRLRVDGCSLQGHAHGCNAQTGCEWQSAAHLGDSLPSYPTNNNSGLAAGDVGTCVPRNCAPKADPTLSRCSAGNQTHSAQLVNCTLTELTCTPELTGCIWTDYHGCQNIEQHFDTLSLFVLFDTLMFGVGLLRTLWSGMLANEIKQEAFSYVIRMKISELLSNSISFVTERATWAHYRQSWRFAEKQLLQTVKAVDTAYRNCEEGKQAQRIDYSNNDEDGGHVKRKEVEKQRKTFDKTRDIEVDKLDMQMLQSYRQSKSNALDYVHGHLTEKLVAAGEKREKAASLATMVLQEGYTSHELSLVLNDIDCRHDNDWFPRTSQEPEPEPEFEPEPETSEVPSEPEGDALHKLFKSLRDQNEATPQHLGSKDDTNPPSAYKSAIQFER